jgi:hypothetical protein
LKQGRTLDILLNKAFGLPGSRVGVWEHFIQGRKQSPPGSKWQRRHQMPNLVQPDLRIADVPARRVMFAKVRIGAIFYSERRWYQRKSARLAVRADTPEYEVVQFKVKKMVRIFDQDKPIPRRLAGPSYEDFLKQSIL